MPLFDDDHLCQCASKSIRFLNDMLTSVVTDERDECNGRNANDAQNTQENLHCCKFSCPWQTVIHSEKDELVCVKGIKSEGD